MVADSTSPAAPTGGESPDYRERIFAAYRETSYAPLNDLTPEGLERSAAGYRRQFGRYLPADREASILELGCGCGAFLLLCRELGYQRVTGVDISSDQVEFCRRQGHRDVHLGEALSFLRNASEPFELIVMSDILEHLPKADALEALVVARERLRDGGRVVVKVPNMSNPLNLRSRYVDFTHELGLTKESLEQLFRVAGYDDITVDGDWQPHRDPLRRLLFDVLAWRLFLLFYRKTMRLTQAVLRGKTLIGVARRPAPAGDR